jgi:phenylalanyl-tRNA synthetase alpha chain
MDLTEIKNKAQKEIEQVSDLKGLDQVFKKYLGKKGQVSLILKNLSSLSNEERVKMGSLANELKKSLNELVQRKREELISLAEKREWIDVTLPGKKPLVGHLHPLTQVKREIMDIFQGMGFEIVSGPEVETEWYNFDALNIPKNHPARDAWDTLWLKTAERLLLRAHTSPVQARYMEKNRPPLRIIVPGKVFRHEATDASHEFQFYQIEGLMVDKDVTVANLKAVIEQFFKRFFKKELKSRLRPDYFPFTEPSFDIGISCTACWGKGCSVCKGTGWLEIAGAGMVHPNVFEACGLDPEEWQGWAFGFGWDRLAMMKYRINDIRLFNSADLRFLNQF